MIDNIIQKLLNAYHAVFSFHSIKNSAIEVQLAAVKQNVNSIEFTKNIDESVIEMYFESDELNK